MMMVAFYCISMHLRPMHGCLFGGTDRSVQHCELPTSSFFFIDHQVVVQECRRARNGKWLCRFLLDLSKPTIARRIVPGNMPSTPPSCLRCRMEQPS